MQRIGAPISRATVSHFIAVILLFGEQTNCMHRTCTYNAQWGGPLRAKIFQLYENAYLFNQLFVHYTFRGHMDVLQLYRLPLKVLA